MELNVNKEPVILSETLYDGQAEQGVEFDYILPDYYPDIFKIMKCTLTPRIVSYSISGSQLFCDGIVYIRVIYLSADSNRMHCIDQRYTYSKTVDLSKPVENANVCITPKTDYCNCRAVSGRRIDVRGSISCKIKVTANKETEMITGVEGMGVETKCKNLNYCGEKLFKSHQFVTREDIETGTDKEGTANILNHDVCVQVTDYKVIANKVVVKGEALLKALFVNQKEDEPDKTDVMEAVIPISQIVDLDGVSDEHTCFIVMRVMDSDLEIKPSDAGDTRIFTSNMTIECNVTAHLEKTVAPLSDMYSTQYETAFNIANVKVEKMPQILNEQLVWKSTIEANDEKLESVRDIRCDLLNVTCRARGNTEMAVSGQANLQIFGEAAGGLPILTEKAEPFELSVPVADIGTDYAVDVNLQVSHVNFVITSDNRVDVRVNILLNACIYRISTIEAASDISVMEEKPKQIDKDYALKLYFADEGEEIWKIAKRYNTSAEAIVSENDLESDMVQIPSMLLIPIV